MRFKPKMTAEYSIYPALPSDTPSHNNTSLPPLTSSHQNRIPASSHPALYQYHKYFTATFSSGSASANFVQDDNSGNGNDTVDSSPSLSISVTKRNSNSPAITRLASIMEATETNTDSKSPSLPDRTASSEETTEHQHNNISFNPHTPYHFSSSNHHHPHPHQHSSFIGDSNSNTDSNTSVSSNETTPSDSAASTPFSTPTRLAPSTCQMTSSGAAAAAAAQAATVASAASSVATKTSVIECKKSSKFDPRLSPSPYRQLLPIALCILSFATVFSILIVYMDTTEIRHQQFRLNMSRDYELLGVAQDDPTLIAFLREIHMKKYPMHFLKKTPEEHLNFTEHHELTPEMAHYVADLVGGKLNGAVIQSLPGQMGTLMTAPWLAETLNWAGVIIEPEPRRYFTLRKQNAHRSKMQVVHACVSPNKHPKEVTIHNEEAEVRINSLLDEETSWFNSRVKCFPLYTIMLASNRIDFDLLSLGVHGRELEILQTLPYNVVNIEVISIHLPEDHENVRGYIQSVTKFLMGKSYRLQKTFGRNYFYQKLNTNRTRKKDIFTKKP